MLADEAGSNNKQALDLCFIPRDFKLIKSYFKPVRQAQTLRQCLSIIALLTNLTESCSWQLYKAWKFVEFQKQGNSFA